MDIKTLKKYCIEKIDQYPELADQIRDFYSLALSEIEEGGSESHECELAWSDIEGMINETRTK